MEDLDLLKSDPQVLGIYGSYTRLKKSGDRYLGLCPLHKESNPSFAVHSDMLWTCFSGCGNGNIFQLIERLENCSFQEAMEKVKKAVGKSEWSETRQKVDSVFKPVSESAKTYKTYPLSAWVKMEEAICNSKEAVRFLDSRGIPLEVAKKLHVGFKQSIGPLAGEAGADIADKGWLVFPSIIGDKIVSVKFRSVVRKKPGGFARQSGMATALWNVETIDCFEPVLLVEGELDALCLEAAGFKAVSVPSAGAQITPAMKDQLMGASEVILAGDNDGGVGTAYMQKLWASLKEKTYLLTWPEGIKDANECLLNHCGGDYTKFKKVVQELISKAKAQPMASVYSLQESMRSGDDTSLADHPDRMRAPWPSVDKMVNIMPGDVVGVNATNSGMGKSTLVLQWTLYNAIKYNRPFVNFQVEMRPSEIATMVAAQILRKDRNFLTNGDKKLAADQLEGVPYFIGFDPVLTEINAVLDLLEAAVRRLSPYGVVLDHFHHLVTGMSNEAQVQTAAMTRIKQIAETYKVVFLNVGQPRKATQQTKARQIHLSDAKGSGAWGDASNAVITIHRELNKSDDPTQSKGVYEDKTLVKLLKGRSMGTGNSAAYITSFGEFASFEEIDSHHDPDPDNGQF